MMYQNKGIIFVLETYVISKSLLIELIEKCVENEEYDFLKDAVKANINEFNIKGYHFTGELPFIHSIESYHESNMNLLNPDILLNHFLMKIGAFLLRLNMKLQQNMHYPQMCLIH